MQVATMTGIKPTLKQRGTKKTSSRGKTSTVISEFQLTAEDFTKFQDFGNRMLCESYGEAAGKAVIFGLQTVTQKVNEHLKKKPIDGLKSIQKAEDLRTYFEHYGNPTRAKGFWFFAEAVGHLGGTESVQTYRLPSGEASFFQDFEAIADGLNWTFKKLSAVLAGIAVNAKA